MRTRERIFIVSLLFSSFVLAAKDPDLFKRDKTETPAERILRKKALGNGGPVFGLKMNLTQLLIPNFSFQAEFSFSRFISLALGASYLPKRGVPDFIYDLQRNPYNSYFSSPIFEGRMITPELRFYPFGRAPKGFYIAAYLQYAHYVAHQTVSYQDFSSQGAPTYSALATHDYKGTTYGLMIGKQWVIAKYLTIDWWIVGGGYGKAKYTYKWEVDGISLTPEQQVFVKEQAEQNFSSFTMFGINPTVETTSNSAFMSAMLPMFSLRFMGICVGFAF
jgi:hypothetical protein